MRRETQNVLLILLGGAVLKISFNGEFVRYVKPSLQPWLVAAGVFTIMVAVVGIVRDLRPAAAPEAGASDDGHSHSHSDDGHPHGHSESGHSEDGPSHGHSHDGHEHSSRSPWLLLLPVLAIFLVAPPALGADKVMRSESVVAAAPAGSGFVPLPDEDAPLLKLSDAITRSIWDDDGSVDNREIRLVGFVVRMGDGTLHLARLTIGCCAADAAPVKVRIQGSGVEGYEPDTWLELRGKMVPDSASEANEYVPAFEVLSATPVAAPSDPYEY